MVNIALALKGVVLMTLEFFEFKTNPPSQRKEGNFIVLVGPSLLGLRGSRRVLADASVRVQSEKQDPLGDVSVAGIRGDTWRWGAG